MSLLFHHLPLVNSFSLLHNCYRQLFPTPCLRGWEHKTWRLVTPKALKVISNFLRLGDFVVWPRKAEG